ncbi:hypothetical protein [Streptomyces sp. NPDC023838]|uniref:hypothetical protein n=1 Tax=Streptomyces sp. NPDC023838 TaxID=3154325 RepID=UPI0033FDF110
MGIAGLLPIWLIAVLGAVFAIAASFFVDKDKRTGCLIASGTLTAALLFPVIALIVGS